MIASLTVHTYILSLSTARYNAQALHVQANLTSLWSCPLLCGTRQVGHPRIIRPVTIQSCPVSKLYICKSTSQHRDQFCCQQIF